jgi:hypothetical protein
MLDSRRGRPTIEGDAMSTPPEGAQLSPDGNYWWDTDANAWQAVAGSAADGAGDAAGSAGADAAAGAAADAAAGGAAADPAADPAAAGSQWPPAGYPEDPAEWTPEQLQYWFGNTTDASEDLAYSADLVNVQPIAELEGSGDQNEGIA